MYFHILYFLLVIQIRTKLVQTLENNGNKLGDVLKNHTKSIYNSTKNQNEDENILKQETHKLLSECGVESDNSYEDDDYGNRRGTNKPKRGNNYDNFGNRRRNSNRRYNSESNYNRYGNRNRGNRDENNSNESNNRRNYGNRNRYNNENYSDEEDSNESDQSGRKYNRTMSNNGYYSGYHNECNENHGYFDGNSRNQWRPFGGYDYGTMRRGFGTLRARRANNDDSQCVSQCVFGYLEVVSSRKRE